MLRRSFVAASVLWAATLPLAAFAATRTHGIDLWYGFALAVYSTGSMLCHQLPQRSFALFGTTLPVCARCTGIYIGSAAMAIGMMTAGSPWKRALKPARSALALAAIPTIVTLIIEWTTGIVPSNAIRFAAGLPVGAAVAWLILSTPSDESLPYESQVAPDGEQRLIR